MESTDFSIMQIRTFTASEALPLEGASVKIIGSGEENRDVKISQITDSDGLTNVVRLPAPSTSLSMSPSSKSIPYSVYDVEITKIGYYPKRIYNVPLFSGTKAMLPIEMIPISYAEDGSPIPIQNLNSVIYENEHLN